MRKKAPHYIDGRAPFKPCRTCSDDYGFEISLIRERLYATNPSWTAVRALDRARVEHARGTRS